MVLKQTVVPTKKQLKVEHKLDKVEKRNEHLEQENLQLKEKVLDLEYQQKRNNLISGGVLDNKNETDLQCINKL